METNDRPVDRTDLLQEIELEELRTFKAEATEELTQLRADLQEACVGGTKETPQGFEQRLNRIEGDLKDLDSDGKLRRILVLFDESLRDRLSTVESGFELRIALLERQAAQNSRVLWTLGSTVILAIITAGMSLIIK